MSGVKILRLLSTIPLLRSKNTEIILFMITSFAVTVSCLTSVNKAEKNEKLSDFSHRCRYEFKSEFGSNFDELDEFVDVCGKQLAMIVGAKQIYINRLWLELKILFTL